MTEAARLLGITPEAVRQRIRRGTIEAEMVNDRWLIVVPPDQQVGHGGNNAPTGTDTEGYKRALDIVEAQLEFSRAELARRDAQVLSLLEQLDTERRRMDRVLEPLSAALSMRQMVEIPERTPPKRRGWREWFR